MDNLYCIAFYGKIPYIYICDYKWKSNNIFILLKEVMQARGSQRKSSEDSK
jgi:hypothetical protein